MTTALREGFLDVGRERGRGHRHAAGDSGDSGDGGPGDGG
jgi:hypothetical protein